VLTSAFYQVVNADSTTFHYSLILSDLMTVFNQLTSAFWLYFES